MTTANDKPIPWRDVPGMAHLDDLGIGATIRAFRQCEAMTLQQASRRLGVSHQMISAYERGERLPTIETALRIAEALGIPAGVLIQDLIRDQLRRAGLSDWQVNIQPAA